MAGLALMCVGIFGCSESSGPAEATIPTAGGPTTLDEGVPCGVPLEVALWLPYRGDVGTFRVYNDEVNLTVEFDVTEPWLMTETQAVFTVGAPPRHARHPWARFRPWRTQVQGVPLGAGHNPPVQHYTYWVNLEEAGLSTGDTLYVRGQADLLKSGDVARRVRPRTAYAGDPERPACVRGRTLFYVIQPCEEGGGEGEEEDGEGTN
jgi:hypothetical protein